MGAPLVKLNMLLENLDVGFARLKNTNRSDYTFSRVFERITTIMRGGFNLRASKSGNTTAHNIGSKHEGYLEHFRELLMKAGVPLEKMYVSHKGIPFLKDFLNCCGFSKSDVHRSINELLGAGHETKREIKKINILEFFSKLSDLKITLEKKKKDPVLEAPAIPYLEIVLHRLGINAQDLKTALSEGRTETGVLNLESFSQHLRRILDNTAPLHLVTPSSDKVAEDIKQLFSLSGMKEENEKVHGAITLDRFVQWLEEVISKQRRSNTSNQDVEQTIRHLMEEVIVDSDDNDSRLQLQSLAAQKLIDDLLGSKDKKKGTDVKDTRIVSHKGGERETTQKTNFDAISTDAEKFSKMLEHGSNHEKHRAIRGGTQKINIPQAIAENRPFTESIKAARQPTLSSSRSLPLYVVDQVSYQISRSIMQGKDNIRLRLKPPHLGTVKLAMEMKGKVLTLDVATESQVTRELLLLHVHELKQLLADQGIRLERMDIHGDYQVGASGEDTQKEHNGEGDRARGRSGRSTVHSVGKGKEGVNAAISETRMDALLDLIA